jgi:hypothetical protein
MTFDDRDRQFLISFANNNPDWDSFKYSKIKDYPSIRWKLYNLGKLNVKKRDEQLNLLKEILT